MATVLVVDDSAFDRHLASQVLVQEEGIEVETADGGTAALDRLAQGGVDLVVTDLQMPLINGIQLVMNIREDFSDIPVILMTGEGSELIAMEALTHGAVNYVPKKMMNEWLPKTVHEALAAQKTERSHEAVLDLATFAEMHFTIRKQTENQNREVIESVVKNLEQTASGILTCSRSQIVRLGVAIKEALEHSLAVNPEIEFEYSLTPEQCKVTLRTRADGRMIFDPSELPESSENTLDTVEGRGFLLIKSHLDDVLFDETGQEVVMVLNAADENSPVES